VDGPRVGGPALVTVRAAGADDVTVVHALETRLFGADAWSEESVRAELTGPRRVAVVACLCEAVVGEAVVGYAVTSSAGDVVDLQRVAVHPEHRRRGLAGLLLATVLSGDERVLLEVSADNRAALALYAAEGFTEIARRGRYYRDGSDAVVMERTPCPGGGRP
jgi:[ribosomal protein S18]-alanine N-acetyltransferase